MNSFRSVGVQVPQPDREARSAVVKPHRETVDGERVLCAHFEHDRLHGLVMMGHGDAVSGLERCGAVFELEHPNDIRRRAFW